MKTANPTAANRMAEIAQTLARNFGQACIRICTEYHVQVRVDGYDRPHDVYVNLDGRFRYRLCGRGNAKNVGTLFALIAAIGVKPKTAVKTPAVAEQTREDVSISALIGYGRRNLPEDIEAAVFCDAGWKEGIAHIAAVFVRRNQYGCEYTAKCVVEPSESVHAAEELAIRIGAWDLAGHAYRECPIFSDSQTAVARLTSVPSLAGRIRWIPRNQNKLAHLLAKPTH